MRFDRVAIAVGVLLMSVPMVAQAPRQDGQWEIKAQMEMAGMPMGMEPMTTTQCVSKEEAKDPQKFLPSADSQSGCKVSDYKVDGNRTTFTLKCDGPPPMSGSGEINYTQDAYTGTMKMDVAGQSMTVRYTAKRVGDCTK